MSTKSVQLQTSALLEGETLSNKAKRSRASGPFHRKVRSCLQSAQQLAKYSDGRVGDIYVLLNQCAIHLETGDSRAYLHMSQSRSGGQQVSALTRETQACLEAASIPATKH